AKRSRVVGAGALGAAVFVKLWPFVLSPVLVVRRSVHGVLTFVAVCAAGTLAWVAWGGFAGPWQVLSFRHARGWQIESVIGELWHLVTGDTTYVDQGSSRVGHMPAAAP